MGQEMKIDRVLNAHNDYTLQGDWLSCHSSHSSQQLRFSLAGNHFTIDPSRLPARPRVSDVPFQVIPPAITPLDRGALDSWNRPSDNRTVCSWPMALVGDEPHSRVIQNPLSALLGIGELIPLLPLNLIHANVSKRDHTVACLMPHGRFCSKVCIRTVELSRFRTPHE